MLNEFSKSQRSIALVVDEYGGTAGIITVEDIMEEIFGEIEDEHDEVEDNELVTNGGQLILNAKLEVDYLNEKYNLAIPEGEYETLSGFILANLEEIPPTGEVFIIDQFEIKILEAAEQKIEKVQLIILD
jgi:CBS domain containing-hemolysin-like protein